jgi:tripartite-type tricarboxylate transporter receptor subunit TctC
MTKLFKASKQWLATLFFGLLICAAQAQNFADKSLRVITPFGAGNTLDAALRVMGEKFKENTGQTLIIENKAGGSGFIAAQAAASAAPDGYTLLLGGTGLMTINPHIFSKVPYDVEKSYKPVSNFLGSALVFAVHASVSAENLSDFIALTKANPGKGTFASYTAGNASHFSGVILNKRAGIDLLHIPFNGTPAATTNLLSGQVQSAFLPLLSIKQHMDSGKVKALAITGDMRSPLAPNVPTFKELGYPDLNLYVWAALFAPAGTPDILIQKLSIEINKALKTTEVIEKFKAMDFTPLPSTPEELTIFVRNDSRRWAEAVKLSGFKASE